MRVLINCRTIFGRVGELMDQRPHIGDVAYLPQNNRFIYYLITKNLSVDKPDYNSITTAIKKLRDFVLVHRVKKLAIPRIGCGLDKLYWPTVKNIIGQVFKDVGCMIKVCNFRKVSKIRIWLCLIFFNLTQIILMVYFVYRTLVMNTNHFE